MEGSQPPPALAHEAVAPRDRAIAGTATLLLLIGMPIGWLGSDTESGDVIGLIVATAICLALMAAVFLRLVPRERAAGRATRTGLIMAIVAAVLVVVFWTGLPFPIAAGAVALGLYGRAAPPQAGEQGRATVAVVLGGVVLALSFVGLLIG